MNSHDTLAPTNERRRRIDRRDSDAARDDSARGYGSAQYDLQERMAGNLRDNNLAFQVGRASVTRGRNSPARPTIPPFTGATACSRCRTKRPRVLLGAMTGWVETEEPDGWRYEVAAPRCMSSKRCRGCRRRGEVSVSVPARIGFYRVTARATAARPRRSRSSKPRIGAERANTVCIQGSKSGRGNSHERRMKVAHLGAGVLAVWR